jgi:hypothetical protein
MVEEAERFRRRAAAENRGRAPRGWRYSSELRALAGSYCRAALAGDSDVASTAAELGVSVASLSRWVRAAPRGESSGLVPVEILDVEAIPVQPGHHSVVTPGGYRIEGLSFSEVERLLGTIR